MLINLYSTSLEVVVNLATDAYHQFEVEKKWYWKLPKKVLNKSNDLKDLARS